MDIRQRLEAFWAGERPDQIPYTIYQNEWRHTASDPTWLPLFKRGLGVTWHVASTSAKTENVEDWVDRWLESGKTIERRTLKTPVGSIYETFADGWRTKFFLETRQDYTVMTYIIRHTRIEPDYDGYLTRERAFPAYCIALVDLQRTPLQTILVDYTGVENFAYHVFDLEAEVLELYDALLENFRRTAQLVAEGPGRYVSVLENFSAEMLGPARYKELLLPVYESTFPALREAGKIVGTHYDGRLARCKDLIATAPIDLIESLTPPPEGDLTLTAARAAWPDKLLWSNINIGCYSLPAKELQDLVLERVQQAAPDGRRLAFEVSEQFPENWPESIGTVLRALEETRS